MKHRDEDQPRPGRASDAPDLGFPKALFISSLDLIKRVVGHTAFRRCLNHQDRQDFEADVHLKLIDHDYAVFRQFKGQSKLETYLIIVIKRLFLDFQIKRWGKWRPSSAARRLGLLAMDLERLVYHEGRRFEEACEALSSARGRPLSAEELAKLFAKIPVRAARRETAVASLANLPAPDGGADAGLRDRQRLEMAGRAQRFLDEAIALLPTEGRVLINLAYVDGLTVAEIAKFRHQNQRRLYRKLERCLRAMRRHLLSKGIEASSVADLVGAPGILVEVAGLQGGDMETLVPSPSNSSGPGSKESNRRGRVS